ncbi:hypothetical protein ACFQ0K_04790 [Nocardioides caeni]|uniref:Uncharacterized protein n=1 Tax=Nocardioides caeni TaxID=574700 RepID=A0A4S8N449_9ACTN|nr:hypothetical protein [Nocardioides caeni]THV10820.1 hypothetical protein E9934_13915 [Nocardioides caeni]
MPPTADDPETGRAPSPACPSWCVTTAGEHATDEPDSWLHEGPRFGAIRTWCLDHEEPVFSATVDDEALADLSAGDLRRLAGDALEAALWIDRQAGAPLPLAGRSVVDLVREAHERATRSA